jgi:serine/threonine-protein phosphatase 2A activator
MPGVVSNRHHWYVLQVNSGMVKMYQAEVLSKFPIMQHFLFCRLLPMPPAEAPAHLQQQTAEGSAAPAFTTA